MSKPILKPGDFFATRNPMWLGRAINVIQWFWSTDAESTYSHAGIVTSKEGDTFEALWTIKNSRLDAYQGQKVIIARYDSLTEDRFNGAYKKLRILHNKQWYPFWRLPFHMFPPLAKYASWKGKFVVCSELVAKFEWMLGIRHGQFTGTNPDRLVDEWHRWQGFSVIFEDVWQ